MVSTSGRCVTHTPQLNTSVEPKASSVASSPISSPAPYSLGHARRSITDRDDPMMASLGKLPTDDDSNRMLIGSGNSRSKHFIQQRPRSTSLAFDLPTLFPNSLAKRSVERRRTSMTFVLPECESMWCVPSTPASISWSAAARAEHFVEPLTASRLEMANLHSDLPSTPDSTLPPSIRSSSSSSSLYSSAPSSTHSSPQPIMDSTPAPLTPPRKQNRPPSRRPSSSPEGSGLSSRPRSIRSFNARLNSFAQKGNYSEVLALIDSTLRGELEIASPLNTYSYTILVKAYCNAGNIAAAEALVKEMGAFAPSKRPNRFTYNILLNACVRDDDIHRASSLFKIMESSGDESLRPDHITFTTLMKGYAAQGDMASARFLLTRLMHHPDPLYRPNHVTYNTMLKGFAANGDLDGAERLLQHMYAQPACQPDLVSMNTIIGGYCRANDMANAERLFAPMLNGTDPGTIVPNAVTFQAMIEGYIRDRNSHDANRLVRVVEQRFGKDVAAQAISAAIGRASQPADPIAPDSLLTMPPAGPIVHAEPAQCSDLNEPIEPAERPEPAAAA